MHYSTILYNCKKKVFTICSQPLKNQLFLGHMRKIQDSAPEQNKNPETVIYQRFRDFSFGDPSEIRTPDTLIKSQVLYRLS